MIDIKDEVAKIVQEAQDAVLDVMELELDEGEWRESVFELTTRMGATPQEHAEVMGWIDTLVSAAAAKALMARITQHTEEQI